MDSEHAQATGADAKLKVVFCWHMHQPGYQDLLNGEFLFPWTYLHAIKDYVDMAAHLESQSGARAVVNFAPILLTQITDYIAQIEAHLSHQQPLRDRVLATLTQTRFPPPNSVAFRELVQACLRANQQRIIQRFPAYAQLASIAKNFDDNPALFYLSDQFLIDLSLWYHLGWMGETVRRSDPRITQLQDKARGFSVEDRRLMLVLILEQLRSLGPRFRALAEQGRVELSMSPYAHPIVPLLLDLHCASEAMPGVHLPHSAVYPGGEARTHWHLQRGLACFEAFFGVRPQGCWASEGALSQATLGVLSAAGFQWTASGDAVLRNSLKSLQPDQVPRSTGPEPANFQHRMVRFGEAPIACFFRDDGLSDLIGFTYADWHADDAVGDLVHHLEQMATTCDDRAGSVVSIIMDGENAWEYYPENAFYFLNQLYQRISNSPLLDLTTFSRALGEGQLRSSTLPRLVAGSWVYGTLSTWIGDTDKNKGWDLLCDAKRQVDEVLHSGALSDSQRQRVEEQLALCEGSDWFWWFGDYNPAHSVSDFDRLYRRHLSNLYTLIGRVPPAALHETISKGGDDPTGRGGVMRSNQPGVT